MAEAQRPVFRVWRWVDLSPAGQRAYVLLVAIKLLQTRNVAAPESWLSAARDALQAMRGDQPRGVGAVELTVGPDGVGSGLRLSSEEWARLESMSPESPLDLLLIHKAAIEYRLSQRDAVPAGLVGIATDLVAFDG
ncbi:MAG: hypothetical protein ACRDZ7_01705 [Acidimicrobiia bacterium]